MGAEMGEHPNAAIVARIAAWEAAGVVDADTAERLRAAERTAVADRPTATETTEISAATDADDAAAGATTEARHHPASELSAAFGPRVSVSEVFAYLGGGFLLAAWYAGATAAFDQRLGTAWNPTVTFAMAAIAMAALALWLGRVDGRRRRAAGVLFVASAIQLAVAGQALIDAVRTHLPPDTYDPGAGPIGVVVGMATGCAAAIAYQRQLRTLLTQFGALLLAGGLAWSLADFADKFVFGRIASAPFLMAPVPWAEPFAIAGWWWLVAAGFALVGRRDARSGTSDGTRRAVLPRLSAGVAAVAGTTMAAMLSRDGAREIEPVLGDLAILAVAGVLLALAVRRDVAAWLYPAALGFVIGLSDVNASYFSGNGGATVPLLVEGLILVGVGLTVDWLRRRLGSRTAPTASP